MQAKVRGTLARSLNHSHSLSIVFPSSSCFLLDPRSLPLLSLSLSPFAPSQLAYTFQVEACLDAIRTGAKAVVIAR